VLTAEGRYWCNGFDLKWIHAHLENADELQQASELLLARLMQFPMPTFAAVNGHTCAAGAMLMLAMDFSIMNEDKGFVFVPGIDLGLAYSPGMSALMAAKLPIWLHRDFIIYGQRYTAKTLSPHGVVEAVPAGRVLARTLERAQSLKGKSKHASTMARIKQTLYHEALAALQHHPDIMFLQPESNPMGFENLAVGCDRPTREASQDFLVRASSAASSSAASSGWDALSADKLGAHKAARSDRIAGLRRLSVVSVAETISGLSIPPRV
jgi:enoyl-CoA hydratase/carnithine racemase